MIHNISLATDITAHITNQAVKLKERWKYEPLTFASPSSTKDWTEVNIEIYPNPANDQLSINANGLISENLVFASIINIDGKVISDIEIRKDLTNIDISYLPQGIYTIKVLNRNQVIFVSKFIKIE